MKLSKDEKSRAEGMSFCVRYLDSHDNDVAALKEEVRRRGVYGIPLTASKAEIKDFEKRVKRSCIKSILLLTMEVLHDEFEFGNRGRGGSPGRIDRYLSRCQQKMSCMGAGFVNWDDLSTALAAEIGLTDDKLKWIDD